MPAYTTVVTHATGDVLPATDWNTDLRDNLAFLHDQGADLASAATITPTNQFHRVTGVVTITTIAAPTGTGQGGNRLLLKFQSAGCAITAGAAIVLTNGPFLSVANGMIEFVWDATLAGWVEIGRVNGQPDLQLDYAQITAPPAGVTATTEGTAVTIITGASVVYDGTKVKIEWWFPYTTGGNRVAVIKRDSSIVGDSGSAGVTPTPTWEWYGRAYDTPTAGAHTYSFAAFTGAAQTLTLQAGLGGTGAQLPAFIRIGKA